MRYAEPDHELALIQIRKALRSYGYDEFHIRWLLSHITIEAALPQHENDNGLANLCRMYLDGRCEAYHIRSVLCTEEEE